MVPSRFAGFKQRDQIGRFLQFLAIFLLQKQPKYLDNCLSILKRITFKASNIASTFLAFFVNLGYFSFYHQVTLRTSRVRKIADDDDDAEEEEDLQNGFSVTLATCEVNRQIFFSLSSSTFCCCCLNDFFSPPAIDQYDGFLQLLFKDFLQHQHLQQLLQHNIR